MQNPVVAPILLALNYANLFDDTRTPEAIFRFLIGVPATCAEVDAALNDRSQLKGSVRGKRTLLLCLNATDWSLRRLRLHAADRDSHSPCLAHLALPFNRSSTPTADTL